MARVASVIPTLRVEKVEDSLPFYQALGFEVAWQHQPQPSGPRLTALAQDAKQVFLTEHPIAPVGAVVHFMVEGLDEIVGRAKAAGLDPKSGPELRPWGDREAYFSDPDGNVLRFGETSGS